MKASDKKAIYRKAARLIEQGYESRACWAIELAQGNLHPDSNNYPYSTARALYIDKMLAGCERTYRLYSPNGDGYTCDSQEAMDARVVALCFMAAILEAGDLP